MTRTIGIVDRIRWIFVCGAALAAAVAACVVLLLGGAQVPPLQPGQSASRAPSAPVRSDSPLDPRLASVATRRAR